MVTHRIETITGKPITEIKNRTYAECDVENGVGTPAGSGTLSADALRSGNGVADSLTESVTATSARQQL